VLDVFEELAWIDIMYAFGIAILSLQLPFQISHQMNHNQDHDAICDRSIVHYCYGDSRWGKRLFNDKSPLSGTEHDVAVSDLSTVLGEIQTAIKHARRHMGLKTCLARFIDLT
jgi:hypothetical protein